jgi:hypothetical protein
VSIKITVPTPIFAHLCGQLPMSVFVSIMGLSYILWIFFVNTHWIKLVDLVRLGKVTDCFIAIKNRLV